MYDSRPERTSARPLGGRPDHDAVAQLGSSSWRCRPLTDRRGATPSPGGASRGLGLDPVRGLGQPVRVGRRAGSWVPGLRALGPGGERRGVGMWAARRRAVAACRAGCVPVRPRSTEGLAPTEGGGSTVPADGLGYLTSSRPGRRRWARPQRLAVASWPGSSRSTGVDRPAAPCPRAVRDLLLATVSLTGWGGVVGPHVQGMRRQFVESRGRGRRPGRWVSADNSMSVIVAASGQYDARPRAGGPGPPVDRSARSCPYG